MKYVVFMSLWPCTDKILIPNWPWMRNGPVLVTLFIQFLCSDWSKFDRWVLKENLCSTLKLNLFTLTTEADRVLCQLVMFLTIFFHWMYKMKCSCYEESSVIHENCCLVKCFTDLYFFYWLLVVSLAILNAVPFVFSRSWTSLAGVLKMPRVSDAF